MLIDAPAIPAFTRADTALESRVRREFSEMPGLKLTLPQACRLFSVERDVCERVFDALRCRGELLNLEGVFVRPGVALYHQSID